MAFYEGSNNKNRKVSKSVHQKGPVSPMGPMIHEFDKETG